MFSILRRRWVLIALSSAALLVAIDYVDVGLEASLHDAFLGFSPLGFDLGWLVFASTVLVASWNVTSYATKSQELRYGRIVSFGIGLIASGWVTSNILIGRDGFIYRIGPFLIPCGYVLVGAGLYRLATKTLRNGEQGTSLNSSLATRRLLITAAFGIGLEALAYLPALRDSSSSYLIVFDTAARAAGIGVIGIVLLVAAGRRGASSAPLAALGVGLLVVMTGVGLLAVPPSVVLRHWRSLFLLSGLLTGTGYFIVGVTAAYVAVRTEHPRDGQVIGERDLRLRATPEGLWVG